MSNISTAFKLVLCVGPVRVLPMDAAMLTMIAALLVAVLASARDQHRLAAKTGERLDELNARYERLDSKYERLDSKFDEHKRTAERHHEQLRSDFAEHKRITEKNHADVTGSLADARERLARIEGHLGIGILPPEPDQ